MKGVARILRTRFLAGVVVTVPVVVTILALRFVFVNLDALLGPWIANLLGHRVPGLGIIATLVLVLLLGLLATNLVGRRLISQLDRLVSELPLIRTIYNATKDIMATATLSRQSAFREVVMIEHPRKGIYSYGFVTSYVVRPEDGRSQHLANVFIPGPPVPTSGVLVVVPVEELIHLDLSIEEGLKIILSAGMASPGELSERTVLEPTSAQSQRAHRT